MQDRQAVPCQMYSSDTSVGAPPDGAEGGRTPAELGGSDACGAGQEWRLVREDREPVVAGPARRGAIGYRSPVGAVEFGGGGSGARRGMRGRWQGAAVRYGRRPVVPGGRWQPAPGRPRDVRALEARAASEDLLAAVRAVTGGGAGVRPQRSTPGGRPAMKQKRHGTSRVIPSPQGGVRQSRIPSPRPRPVHGVSPGPEGRR